MKRINNVLGKTALNAIAFSVCFHAANAQAFEVSQQPLMLVESVAPNLIFTLDDSMSMQHSHVPDGLSDPHSRRAKSSTYNALYYNPAVTYTRPKQANGTEFSTSFTSAYVNGFTGGTTVNLSNNYRVSWAASYVGPTQSENPAADYQFTVSLINGSSTNHTTESRATPYTVKRTGNGTCTLTGAGYSNSSTPCTQASGSNARNATVNLRTRGVRAYYYVFDTSLPSCNNNSIHNDNCYRHQEVTSEEEENFANWYSFYRTRALATNSAAHIAFHELPSAIRFTWQNLSETGATNLKNRFKVYNSSHRNDFFTWLKNEDFNLGGTPLRSAIQRAGNFLGTADAWVQTPGQSGGTNHACRPSFHIMMTDGAWNGDSNISLPAKNDNANFSLPDGTAYPRSAPYRDSQGTPLVSDFALHYWATDLRPTLADEVRPYIPYTNANSTTQYWDPRNNPATWQHMVNYIVGLGLSNSLTDPAWSGHAFSGAGYESLKSGDAEWPSVGNNPTSTSNTSIGKVYDLWHAAINSRGDFFSVESPEDMVEAFTDIINRIAERTATAAKPGVSTSVGDQDPADPYAIDITNRVFLSAYDSSDWTGDLTRKDYIRNLTESGVQEVTRWSARNTIPAHSARNIMMANAAGDALVQFQWANLDNDTQTLYNKNPDSPGGNTVDNLGAERVSYLRGDRSREGDTETSFRQRSSVLGDIVNSSPVVVGAPSYVPYLADRIDGARGDYRQFQSDHAARQELVYVGANDGMLHAFDAQSGAEVFAFVPTAVLKKMHKYTGHKYQGGAHLYSVDGTPVVRDVYINGEWRTVLIGTLRAGGKSLFALDITDPTQITLLWEVTNETVGYENLGHTFAQPEIVRLHSGQWAILLGNGYESDTNAASLMVIDIADGALLTELVVDDGSAGPNGLSSVRGADNNGDGIVDYAYAGDLKGNLWRFDLIETTADTSIPDPFLRTLQSGVTPASFQVSYGGHPLFTAKDTTAAADSQAQAITAPPALVRHPTRRGYIVVFGTGKYFETADAAPDTSRNMTVYGIWDRKTRAQPTSSPGTRTRSNLQQQVITTDKTVTFSQTEGATVTREVRIITNNPIVWYTPGTQPGQEDDDSRVAKWGWYVDLRVDGQAREGEMMVNQMLVRGDTVLFSSLIPNEDPCADGTSGWIYAINAHTGARTSYPALDLNMDGKFDSKDNDGTTVVSGYQSSNATGGIAISKDSLIFPDGTGFLPSPDLQGRQSWQVMPLEIETEAE